MKPFTSRRTRLLLAGMAASAAFVGGPIVAEAHADPMDTVGVQAAIVCADLDANPTVAQILWERNRLLATYIESDENAVMHYAMNTMCPEYRYLAYAALRQLLQSARPGQEGGVSV